MTRLSIIFAFLVFLPLYTFSQQPIDFKFEEDKEGILLLENGKPRFFYQAATKSKDGQYPRANYIHPLYGLDREILTEDFPEDHLHHRGIFWAWHQLFAEGKRVGDPWICEGVKWDVVETNTGTKPREAIIKTKVNWVGINEGMEKPIVQEEATITFRRLKKDVFALEFHIRLTALVEGVELGGSEDEKGYGGFSPRFKLPENLVFQSNMGRVEPKNLAVPAGPWMSMEGDFSGNGKSGIVIMGEPDKLPQYQGWILRYRESMQNMAFPGRKPKPIPKGESLAFRNQILVYKDLNQKELERYYQKFSESGK